MYLYFVIVAYSSANFYQMDKLNTWFLFYFIYKKNFLVICLESK